MIALLYCYKNGYVKGDFSPYVCGKLQRVIAMEKYDTGVIKMYSMTGFFACHNV